MANNFPIYHGISLAENAYIENLNVEILTADPVPVGPGRLWFNQTERTFKYSGLDNVGAVIVRTINSAEQSAADFSAEVAARIAGDAATLSSAQSYADARKVEALAYTDAAKQEILGGIPPATLDTINEIAAALQNNPNIVSVLNTTITDGIAAAKAELKGTVTTALDTLGEIETALNAEIADRAAGDIAVTGVFNGKIGTMGSLTTDAQSTLVAAINEVDAHVDSEVSRASGAESTLSGRITTLEGQVSGNTGNLADLHTTAKGTIVAAINETFDALAQEIVDRGAAISTEVTNRNSAISSAIATEVLNRDGAISSAIATEVSDRNLAIGSAISTEVTNRNAAISTATGSVRTDYNSRLFTFESSSPATTHTVTHNLNANFVNFSVYVKRANGKYRNDVVSVEEFDTNTLKVYLSKASDIKMSVVSMVAL